MMQTAEDHLFELISVLLEIISRHGNIGIVLYI